MANRKLTRPTLLSGIAPSGNLHIGNYLGALKQWVDLQEKCMVFAMVADLHAITTPQDPKKFSKKILEIAKIMIASGIDPKKSVVFLQSQVSAHTGLGWILNTLIPIGELERMTQFKEKKEKAGVLAGLLNYPILMAADILLYKCDLVPVGEDQAQHLEITRTLARKFNHQFGKVFKEPKALILKETARVMGLDDPKKKMSKSSENPANYIALLDSPEEIRKKIKSAVTDSDKEVRYDEKEKPAISNLVAIFSAFSGKTHKEIEDAYRDKGYAEFKKDLAEVIIAVLEPIQKRFKELDNDEVLKILKQGAKRAETIAEKTLKDAKEKMGFLAR